MIPKQAGGKLNLIRYAVKLQLASKRDQRSVSD